MLGLPDRIRRVGVMISAPEQTRPSRGLLPRGVLRIAIEPRIGRLMNDADNALASHRGKVRTHQVVMRQIHDGAIGEGANLQRLKQKENAENGKFHPGTAGEYQSTIEAC